MCEDQLCVTFQCCPPNSAYASSRTHGRIVPPHTLELRQGQERCPSTVHKKSSLVFFPSYVPALFAVRKPPISLFQRVRVVLNKARTLSLGKLGGGFSGGPVDKTLCSPCRRSVFDPRS